MSKTVWYAHLQGEGKLNQSVPEAFGFFVHAMVHADSEQTALAQIRKSLADDDLELLKVRHSGRFDSFEWDTTAKAMEMDNLASRARVEPGEVFFSQFDTWPLRRRRSAD